MASAWATAAMAKREGETVTAFGLETLDGLPLCVFVWGQRTADGVDTRGAEVVAPKPVGWLCRLSFSVAMRVLAEGDLLSGEELLDEIEEWKHEALHG